MKSYFEYYYSVRKNGKQGDKILSRLIYFTELNTCELCGFTSTPKKVQFRNDVYGWNCNRSNTGYVINDGIEPKTLLCMSCWNKVRPNAYKQDYAYYLEKMVRKIKRTITEERKSMK